MYSLENLANISICSLRSDLNTFKQHLLQQHLELDMFANDLKSKYDIQASHLHELFQVNLIFNCNYVYS